MCSISVLSTSNLSPIFFFNFLVYKSWLMCGWPSWLPPGPVYLWLRSSIVWLRRFPGRHWMRWIEHNSDYQKMCLRGMPEFHIDPTKNRWRRVFKGRGGDGVWWNGMMLEVFSVENLGGITLTRATMAACLTSRMKISIVTSCCIRPLRSSSIVLGAVSKTTTRITSWPSGVCQQRKLESRIVERWSSNSGCWKKVKKGAPGGRFSLVSPNELANCPGFFPPKKSGSIWIHPSSSIFGLLWKP